MSDDFIKKILQDCYGVTDVSWKSESIVEISRTKYPPFQAAILREKLVEQKHVVPFVSTPVAVIANFPKIGQWTGAAIELCENHGKAWGQWSVLIRSLNNENPETTTDPKISFSRRGLAQHTRIDEVSFQSDHVLIVKHEKGNTFRVALVYQYDLCGDDVRKSWDDFGPFDLLLKTNPNGSIQGDAEDAAESLGIKVFSFGDLMSYFAKGKFEDV